MNIFAPITAPRKVDKDRGDGIAAGEKGIAKWRYN